MTDISEVATWLSAVDDRSAARDAGTTAFSTNVYSGPRMQKSLRITRLGIGATLLIGLGFPAAAMSPAAPKSKVTANSSGDLSTVLRPGDRQSAEGLSLPRRWSVQLAGSFSKDRALASFVGLRDRHRDALAIGSPIIINTPYGNRGPSAFYRVHLPASSRTAAIELCTKLHSDGEGCIVLATP
jgi:hypothetical protein